MCAKTSRSTLALFFSRVPREPARSRDRHSYTPLSPDGLAQLASSEGRLRGLRGSESLGKTATATLSPEPLHIGSGHNMAQLHPLVLCILALLEGLQSTTTVITCTKPRTPGTLVVAYADGASQVLLHPQQATVRLSPFLFCLASSRVCSHTLTLVRVRLLLGGPPARPFRARW